jgi:hypothetical protein
MIDTPVLTYDLFSETSVHLIGSTYVGTNPHAHSRWQIALASDPTFAAPIFDTDTILPPTPVLPPGSGVLVTDIDPTAFPSGTQVDGTVLTAANTTPPLTPVEVSPKFKTNAFPSGRPAVRALVNQGFSIPRPVQDDWTIYAVVANIIGAGAGAQWYQNGALIDCETGGVVADFGMNVRADGRLVIGTGGDASNTGTHVINDGPHVLAWRRVKATATVEAWVDGVLDVTLINNASSLSANPLMYFAISPSVGRIQCDYGRMRAYSTAHSNGERAAMEDALREMYLVVPMVSPPVTDRLVTDLPFDAAIIARLRYADSLGALSDWSNVLPIQLRRQFGYDPSPLPWHPRFVLGVTEYVLSYPVTRWIPGERTTGSAARAANGAGGNQTRLRRYTLGLTLRFTDDEWPIVREFIRKVQGGRQFIWIPNPEGTQPMPDQFSVVLDSPRVTDPIRPSRDPQYLHILYLPIVLASRAPFATYYFPVPEEFVPIDLGAPPPDVDSTIVGIGPPGTYAGVGVDIVPYHTGALFTGKQVMNSKPTLPNGRADTSDSLPITITFDAPVSSVTITCYDPTYDGNFMIAYDGADLELGRVEFPFIGTHELTRKIEFPGIYKIVLQPAAGDFVAFYDLMFTP